MTEFLSHRLSSATPAYGGQISFERQIKSSISSGQNSNSFSFSMSNHLGTHIDFPKHFVNSGKSLNDYPSSFWVNRRALFIEIPCELGQLIKSSDVEFAMKKIKSVAFEERDTLLVRTSFEKLRQTDQYWSSNPGFLPEVASFLKEKYPNIQILGMDTISLTSYLHREIGREAHRAFLEAEVGEPILLLEDMKLSPASSPVIELTVLPLCIEDADGAPCTAVGRWNT
ncbi:MAG: cyclase family protein [Bdellovibrionales bacterium]